MVTRHAIIVALIVAATGCSNRAETLRAQNSVYDADFAAVYSRTYDTVRALYPSLDDNPAAGTIKTAWHPIRFNNNFDDPKAAATTDRALGLDVANNNNGLSGPTSSTQRRYFIRFDVRIMGGRPWQVRVKGHASEWVVGNAVPTEMRGADAPHWLTGRTEALQVAIYQAMSEFAVEAKSAPTVIVADEPAAAPADFGPIPDGANATLLQVKAALAQRDIDGLRKQLADDVAWSAGAPGGADAALALWQADPSTLVAMEAVIDAGCVVDKAVVVCGKSESARGWQLRLEARAGTWLVTSFLRDE